MTLDISPRDLKLMGFKVLRSKRRMSQYGIVYHIPTRTFRVDGVVTDFDDEAQLIRFIKNRTPKDATRDSQSDL